MATKKQLAALAKARRARAAKAKTSRTRSKPKAKSRKAGPIMYGVEVETSLGHGYLTGWGKEGPEFDTLPSKALQSSKAMATHFAHAIFTNRPRGVKSVKTVIVKGGSKKK